MFCKSSDATMASKPSPLKLTYFDGRGRGELLRLLMAYGKKNYTDERITFDQWPGLKGKTPFGGLPVLNINGREFGQGVGLALFLAREMGLYGSNNMDNLMIDQITLCKEDVIVGEAKAKFEKDEGARADIIKGFTSDGGIYPKFFGFYNKVIKENPARSGFAVGKKMSLADVVIFDNTDWAANNLPAALDKFPELKALRAKVASVDGIKQYLAKRPSAPF